MKNSLLFFFLVMLCCACKEKPALKSENADKFHNARQYAGIRGFRIYYETYGSGEPLLFIHNNGASTESFRNQVPYFAEKFRVILADSRAQGKSADDGDSLSYEMMADDMSALLDYLKIDSCNVVGWSDGGINGLLMAIRHPRKVKKLAVTGANLWPDTTAVDPWVHNMVKNKYDSLSKLPATPALKNSLKVLRLLPYEPHISVEDVKKIGCPVLVIAGDHDVIQPRHTLLIAEAIPRSYLWIIPDAGHFTPVYHKDEFNRIVMDFLTQPYRCIQGKGRFQ